MFLIFMPVAKHDCHARAFRDSSKAAQ